MIKKEDIKIGLEFRWDKERIKVMDDGRYGHYYETDSIPYFLTNDSKFPTLFTISTNGGNTVTCSDCASIRVLVIKKDDIAEYAHIESAKEEELDEDSLSVPLKVKFDDMNLALHYAEDVKKEMSCEELKYTTDDMVNHPSHYSWLKELCGVEPIDICRHFDFAIGSALKYLMRKGKEEMSLTEKEQRAQDLKKAVFYIQDEIKLLEETDERD